LAPKPSGRKTFAWNGSRGPQVRIEPKLEWTLFGFSLNAFLFFFPFGCAELRPAEVYFQMHLLARQSAAAVSQQNQLVETMQSPELWLLRAIHLNPSCPRYWKALLQQIYV